MQEKNGVRQELFICLKVACLALLLAVAYQLFVVENHFAPAGLNGIATMVQYKTGFGIGYTSLIINVPLCALAWFLVDRAFARRSLIFCLVYSLVMIGLQQVDLSAVQYNAQGHDTIFPALLSGLLAGAVYGGCFKLNASTGGVDIISKYISKRDPRINFFWITFLLNSAVAVSSFFVYAIPGADGRMTYDYKPVCLCVLYCFMSNYIGNRVIEGTRAAIKFTVITSHPDEITADIFAKLKHGVTRMPAMGSFRKEERAVLVCVVNKHQIMDFQNILMGYDDTFSFSEEVTRTYGNFKRIKR